MCSRYNAFIEQDVQTDEQLEPANATNNEELQMIKQQYNQIYGYLEQKNHESLNLNIYNLTIL